MDKCHFKAIKLINFLGHPPMLLFVWIISLISLPNFGNAQEADLTIYFKEPASNHLEALPIGNAQIGGLIFGDPNDDRIVLNEKSLWSGGVQNADRENAHHYLEEIQLLLVNGENKEAENLLQEHFICEGEGSGRGNGANLHYGSFQTLGDLRVKWKHDNEEYSNYSRKLNLEKAIATTKWEKSGVEFNQTAFTSLAENLMVIHYKASQEKAISFSVSLNRDENAEIHGVGDDQLLLQGQLPNQNQPGMRFASLLKVVPVGGAVSFRTGELEIVDADECFLVLSASTDYNIDEPSAPKGDPNTTVKNNLDSFKIEGAMDRHVRKFTGLFNRNQFTLANHEENISELSTPERLERFANGENDSQLPVLYYNFGKYLLISSSQPGFLPSNLQGIWAPEYQAPWNGDYHLDINIQMNYWLAEPLGLGELTEPLHRFTANLVDNGAKSAAAYYDAPGWVAHVISNPWHFTSPGEGASWGSTMTGGAWLTGHIWEHFRFSRDTAFLEEYYPVLKGAAEFLDAVLIEDPETGYMVTAPSNSPENAYITPDGFIGHTCMGPTMDMQICREVFGNTIEAAKILGRDTEFTEVLADKIKRLAPNQIGENGDLNEWLHDWEDADPQHRHVSHLYGLHPYDEITPWGTPEIAEAARKTLENRGDGGTGWSKAWKINFWARLGDGDRALSLFHELLKPAGGDGTKIVMDHGGTYPNLFCAHPPFQIDGNFGGVAGVIEMLMQSHGKEEEIRILPALPTHHSWQEGRMTGMRARNGFVVDFNWSNGIVQNGEFTSTLGMDLNLILSPNLRLTDSKGKVLAENNTKNNQSINIQTRKGEKYQLVSINP